MFGEIRGGEAFDLLQLSSRRGTATRSPRFTQTARRTPFRALRRAFYKAVSRCPISRLRPMSPIPWTSSSR